MIVVGNRPTQDRFLNSQFLIFQILKNVRKGYVEMKEKIYLETFEKCPGSVCFPLLFLFTKIENLKILGIHTDLISQITFECQINILPLVVLSIFFQPSYPPFHKVSRSPGFFGNLNFNSN